MDLWSFSRDHLRGLRPDAEQHIERFARAVVEQARRGEDDEIVLVGHSTGGALISRDRRPSAGLRAQTGTTDGLKRV